MMILTRIGMEPDEIPKYIQVAMQGCSLERLEMAAKIIRQALEKEYEKGYNDACIDCGFDDVYLNPDRDKSHIDFGGVGDDKALDGQIMERAASNVRYELEDIKKSANNQYLIAFNSGYTAGYEKGYEDGFSMVSDK